MLCSRSLRRLSTQERLFTFLSAPLPGSQRDSPRPTHAHASGSRTKDTHPPCDGILRRLRRLRIARCPASPLAAVAAHGAGFGCCNNGGAYCGGSQCRLSQCLRHHGIARIGVSLPIGNLDTLCRCYLYIAGKESKADVVDDDARLRRNCGRCRFGRWCQASVVGHSLRPGASVLFGPIEKRYLLGSPAQLASPATFNATHRRDCTRQSLAQTRSTSRTNGPRTMPPHLKGKAVCSRQSVSLPRGAPQKPPAHCIRFIPPTPRGDNAREAEYQRERQCPESGHLT